MKRLSATVFAALLLVGAGMLGCDTARTSDEESVRALLDASEYTDEESSVRYGSADSTLGAGNGAELPILAGYQYLPFVRFHRYIPRTGITRTVEVTIPAYPGYDDTTALATITTDIVGELRVTTDTSTNPILVWRKPFHDVSVRRVYLTKTRANRRTPRGGWHIVKVSPVQITTQNPDYNLRIVRLRATARPSGANFELVTADTLLAKDELPIFRPNDTVTLQLEMASDGDSCWAFLHPGRVGNERPRYWRQAYWKTGTLTFERVWVVGEEQYDRPRVRPSVHDAIGWGTLWGDTTQRYVATAWGIPCIVRQPGQRIPDDE